MVIERDIELGIKGLTASSARPESAARVMLLSDRRAARQARQPGATWVRSRRKALSACEICRVLGINRFDEPQVSSGDLFDTLYVQRQISADSAKSTAA